MCNLLLAHQTRRCLPFPSRGSPVNHSASLLGLLLEAAPCVDANRDDLGPLGLEVLDDCASSPRLPAWPEEDRQSRLCAHLKVRDKLLAFLFMERVEHCTLLHEDEKKRSHRLCVCRAIKMYTRWVQREGCIFVACNSAPEEESVVHF
jgi:hypothetical protein